MYGQVTTHCTPGQPSRCFHAQSTDVATGVSRSHDPGMRIGSRSGFTLIELVIAAFIFAVGALALEATAAASLRRMRRSADLAFAAAVARSRMETLAASRCDLLKGGVDTMGLVVSSWAVEQSGSAQIRAVSQTVSYQLDGVTRSDSYRSLVPCTQ